MATGMGTGAAASTDGERGAGAAAALRTWTIQTRALASSEHWPSSWLTKHVMSIPSDSHCSAARARAPPAAPACTRTRRRQRTLRARQARRDRYSSWLLHPILTRRARRDRYSLWLRHPILTRHTSLLDDPPTSERAGRGAPLGRRAQRRHSGGRGARVRVVVGGLDESLAARSRRGDPPPSGGAQRKRRASARRRGKRGGSSVNAGKRWPVRA